MDDNLKSGPNGFYKNGEIYVDINAGNNGEGLILFTVSHELTHFMRDFAPEQFDTYAKFLFDNYAKRGLSVRQAVHSEMMKHTNLRYDEAYEEVVARLSESFLRDVHLTDKSRELYNTDRTVWEKIRDGLQSIVERIERWMVGLSPESDLGKIGQKMAQENREILDRFVAGIKAASENAAYIKNTTDEGGVRMMARHRAKVYHVFNSGVFPQFDEADSDASEQAIRWARKENVLVGDQKLVPFRNTWYIIEKFEDTPYKYQVVDAIPSNRIEQIKQMVEENNERNYESKLAETQNDISDVYRTAIEDGEERHNVDDILSGDTEKDQGIFGLDDHQDSQRENQLDTRSGDVGSDKNRSGNGAAGLDRSRDSIDRIPYKYAVKNNDTERAQRIVDRVANQAFADSKVRGKDGKLRKVYHWTNSDFFTFETGRSGKNQGQTHGDGIYVSTSPDEFSYAGSKRMELYANITNPFEMQLTDDQAREVLERYGATKHNLDKYDGLYRNHAMAALTSPVKVFDYLKEYAADNDIKVSDILKQLGYDGVHDGSEWVAFDSNQLKSADPVTYDDNGNVIPLSERFNSEEKDIRYDSRDDWSDLIWDDIDEDPSDTDLIRHHLVANNDAIGEILNRTHSLCNLLSCCSSVAYRVCIILEHTFHVKQNVRLCRMGGHCPPAGDHRSPLQFGVVFLRLLWYNIVVQIIRRFIMITKDMIIGDVLDKYPTTAPLFLNMGMHCLGCPASRGESIEQACMVHGADADQLVKSLNDFIAE